MVLSSRQSSAHRGCSFLHWRHMKLHDCSRDARIKQKYRHLWRRKQKFSVRGRLNGEYAISFSISLSFLGEPFQLPCSMNKPRTVTQQLCFPAQHYRHVKFTSHTAQRDQMTGKLMHTHVWSKIRRTITGWLSGHNTNSSEFFAWPERLV